MSAFDRNMLRPARFHFVNLAKTMPSNVRMKTLEIQWEIVVFIENVMTKNNFSIKNIEN